MASAGTKQAASQYNLDIQKLVAWGNRSSASPASTASSPPTGVIRVPGFTVQSGLPYFVEAYFHTDSSVASDILRVELRYTTDASTPTSTSAVLPGAIGDFQTPTNASWRKSDSIRTLYVPPSTLTLSLWLGVGRIAGTGNCTLFADGTYMTDVYVWLASPTAITDTGVDL